MRLETYGTAQTTAHRSSMLLRSIFQLCINNSSETGGPNGTAQTRLLTNVPLKLRRMVECKAEKILNKKSRRMMIRLKVSGRSL